MKIKYLDLIREIVIRGLEDEDVKIGLFGSFADGTNTYASDIDIAVIPKGQLINRWKLSTIREKLEETTIPYTIDLVDFSTVSDSVKNTALENILWWRL